MVTELSERGVRRRVGNLVVSIEAGGIRIRGFRKRRSVLVPFAWIVRQGMIEKGGYRLTEEEWRDPVTSFLEGKGRRK